MSLTPALIGGLLVCVLSASAAEPWTLQQVLEYVQAHNPDALAARARIAASRAGMQQANAAFWPRLQFQSSYIRTDNPMQVFGSVLNQRAYSSSLDFNDVPDVDNLNVRGVATLPLYTGGKIRAQRSAAAANAEASQLESKAVQNLLAYEVVDAFNAVLKSRRFISAAEASVNAFEKALETANRRLAGGTILKSDALDVEVRLAEAREDLVRVRNAHALALRSLRNLLALEEADDFDVAESVPEISAPQTADYSGRPELAAALQREKAAASELRAAKAGYLPKVNAFGNLDYDYGWKYENGGSSYTAGARLDWDVFDGNLTRAKVSESAANLQWAREQVRKTRLAIDLEAEQARLNLTTAGERLRVSERAVEQAQESADLTRTRFDQGLALTTQLIDAEAALLATRVRRAEAEADRRVAVAALRKALGFPQLEP